jgi:pilus assembly protein Flp/PilA
VSIDLLYWLRKSCLSGRNPGGMEGSCCHSPLISFGVKQMLKFANSVKKFIVSEDGPTAVEYAVMLALIIVVCLAAISTIGNAANSKFEQVGTYLT